MKRILAAVLIVAMLMGVGVPVMAQDAQSIALGEAVRVTFIGGECQRFVFIPPEDGEYSFYSFDLEGDAYGRIYNENFELLDANDDSTGEGNFCVVAFLTAGASYYLDADAINAWTSYQCIITKAVRPTELTLSQTSLENYPGENTWLDIFFSPRNSIREDVVWSSSNDAVATVDDWGVVTLWGVGTAVITATSENGLRDDCTVTVKEPLPLICNGGVQAEPIEGRCHFTFTPEQDGTYGLWVTGDEEDLRGSAYIPGVGDGSQDLTASRCTFWELEAGVTYYPEVWISWGDYQVWIAPAQEATGIRLSESQIVGYPTTGGYLEVLFQPRPAFPEKVTWTFSDETVAEYDYGHIRFLKPGTTTVTATTESGLTASCWVVCIEPPEVYTDQWISCDLSASGPMMFIPEETGYYQLSFRDVDGYIYVEIWNERGVICTVDGAVGRRTDEPVYAYMYAGESYFLDVRAADMADPDYQMILQKVPAPEVLLPKPAQYTVYQGQRGEVYYDFSPDGCGKEWVIWSTGDTDILELHSDGCYYALMPGNATVSGVSRSGLTATVQIHVLPVPEGEMLGDTCGSCGLNLLWQLDEEGTLTITGFGAVNYWRAFGSDRRINRVRLPEGITLLGTGMFYGCKNLTEITIPAKVMEIEEKAFQNCDKLQTVSFLGSAPIIGENVFQGVTATVYYPASDPSWTEQVRQSYGGDLTWVACDPNAGVTLEGQITSGGTGEVTLELCEVDGTEIQTLTEESSYAFQSLLPGEYLLTLSKENHVSRTYPVTVGYDPVQLDVAVCLLGDVNGDGRVNVVDAAKAYAHSKKAALLTNYDFLCADANGDGKVNVVDAAKIYAHAKKSAPLW